MPEISRFYGISIRMYFGDHLPPYFHAEYSGREALIDIDRLNVIAGSLPARGLRLVLEWAGLHQQELRDNWDLAVNLQSLARIDPLN